MDFGTILVRQNSIAMGNQGAIEPVVKDQPVQDTDTSGEYILPVPFSQTQRQLLDAIISSHYSELLAYFSDEEYPDAARAERALGSLKQMAENIQTVCVHPALLIDHFLPKSLVHRDAPNALQRYSGMFRVLGMLVRLFSELNLQVGLVAKAGRTTDLLEAFLIDKPVNCYRYSGQPLREPRNQKANLSTIYLIPSSLRHLTAAVNSAFDVIIAVDDTFDLSSDYATGLRSQLRDPSIRKPMAPVITLVPLNTIIHASLSNPDAGINALAAAVVLRADAGKIPNELTQLYEYDLMPLGAWFRDPDGAWLLPRTAQLPEVGSKDVYTTLMQTPSVAAQRSIDQDPNVKRVKIENGSVPDDNGFSAKLLESHQKMIASIERTQKELDNYRSTATRRENALDEARERILKLTIAGKDKQNNRDANESRALRFKGELEQSQKREEELKAKIEELEKLLAAKDTDGLGRKYVDVSKRANSVTEELESVKQKLKTQETMVEALKTEFANASKTILELNSKISAITEECNKYQEQAAGQVVRLRELAINSEIQSKDAKIKQLEQELQNMKAAVSIADSERAASTRERSRFSNRTGGQGRSKSNSSYSPAP